MSATCDAPRVDYWDGQVIDAEYEYDYGGGEGGGGWYYSLGILLWVSGLRPPMTRQGLPIGPCY